MIISNIITFQAEWTGFIRVPVTGNYVFRAEADDGFLVAINNQNLMARALAQDIKFKSWLDTRQFDEEVIL